MNLFKHYFTDHKGFLVYMQNKQGPGIIDGVVTIFDPISSKAVKPFLGLDGYFKKQNTRWLYHKANTFI